MTAYNKQDFEKDFMKRTLKIVNQYSGSFEATLLMNCLLGLVVIPKERLLSYIPDDSIDQMQEWGIFQTSIISVGDVSKENPEPHTVRGIVINLRHSLAHSNFDPYTRLNNESGNEEVAGFIFNDSSRFKAKISLKEIADFVETLCRHLINDDSE